MTGDPDIDELYAWCDKTFTRKGADYSMGRGHDDRLYNFRAGADMLGLTMEQVWAVYAWKHWTSVMRYCKDGKVDSEGIEGRIGDLVVYLTLLYKMVKEKERVENSKVVAVR